MREPQIRARLLASLHHRYGADPTTLIRQELGLCAGARRVDVAVINGELNGFEIKSDQDTLERLAGQAEAYGMVLDRVTLVTTSRYLDQAARIVPDWWGLIRAEPSIEEAAADQIALTSVRPAMENIGHDAFALAQLLWRDEALAALQTLDLHHGLSRSRRWILWQRLAETVPLVELKRVVRDRLRARPGWPGGQ